MTHSKLKRIFIAVLIATAVSTGFYFLFLSQSEVEIIDIQNVLERPNDQLFGWQYPVAMFPDVGPVADQLAYSTIRDPGGIPQGLPVRLKIPAIRIDSAIEDALITPDGRMDVPYGSVNVAWFSLGPKPGHPGSAAIGGHFGINAGVKFVFYDLDKLIIGDRIYIIDDNGKTLVFQVRKIELFERNADATTVFTSSDGLAHLNLITCEGVWNRINDTYPLRRVVFADAVLDEGVTEASAPVFRSLSLGARGEDVTELQTILVEKGFLVIPRGVSKGYFGSLTRAAVAKYQTSVDLSSTGVFNSVTRSKLIPVTTIVTEPTLPSTSIISRSLGIGDKGEDVTELQTILIKKGFLVLPSGISKGYFGTLTRSAVIKYQTSVGISPTGIFDDATRAMLIPVLEEVRDLSLPSTAIILGSQSFIKVLMEHARSLFATLTDALITSTLLLAIIFTALYSVKSRYKKKKSKI